MEHVFILAKMSLLGFDALRDEDYLIFFKLHIRLMPIIHIGTTTQIYYLTLWFVLSHFYVS